MKYRSANNVLSSVSKVLALALIASCGASENPSDASTNSSNLAGQNTTEASGNGAVTISTGSGGGGANESAGSGGAVVTTGGDGANESAGSEGDLDTTGSRDAGNLDGATAVANDASVASADSGKSEAGNTGGTGGSDATDCTTPSQPSLLIGWASQNNGTTGGGNQTPVIVRTEQELNQGISGNEAGVVYVSGSITGSFAVGSNKTIVGICGAEIHGHIGISGQSNVILRNLKVVGNNCSDSPMDCSSGADAISVNGGSQYIWIDHLDVSDGSDGNLDITQGADFITVSWTKFSYSTRRSDLEAGASGHRFSNLIGASDTDERDPGHLNITYHHCWWAQNVDQRMPRSRRGQIHVFNNLFTASSNSYCTNAGQDAKLLVQNNIYLSVNNPLTITQNGSLKSEGNDFSGSTGSKSGSGVGFSPPYTFLLDSTSGLEAVIRSEVGPQ